jgi:hypothetical protein
MSLPPRQFQPGISKCIYQRRSPNSQNPVPCSRATDSREPLPMGNTSAWRLGRVIKCADQANVICDGNSNSERRIGQQGHTGEHTPGSAGPSPGKPVLRDFDVTSSKTCLSPALVAFLSFPQSNLLRMSNIHGE